MESLRDEMESLFIKQWHPVPRVPCANTRKLLNKEMAPHEPDAFSMNSLAALYNPPGYIITLGRRGTQVIEARRQSGKRDGD